jgi:carbamoyltransferase
LIILGLRSKHDASAAIVVDGELVAASTEERFSHKKHHFGFPKQSIEYVLAEAGLEPHQVDIVARDGISMAKTISRLLRQPRYAWTPRLYRDVLDKALNRYVLRKRDTKEDEEIRLQGMGFAPNWSYVEHHLGHAAYAYYASGLKEATVVVLDGRGHYLGGGVYLGHDGHLECLGEIIAEGGSLGLFYSAVTDALGFRVGDGEGKTMGLACYGDPQVALADVEAFAPKVTGLQTVRHKEWQLDTAVYDDRLYGHYRESALVRLLIDKHGEANVAAAVQAILERELKSLVRNAVKATGIRDLIGGGGVFLNVKASKALLDEQIVDSIYIPPGPGDEGLAAGYALAAYVRHNNVSPIPIQSAYLGPAFSEEDILQELQSRDNITYQNLSFENTPAQTAQLIADGNVIGWFQGRMEWGPRALGNRSVLADPRDPDMRDRINERLKKRDWFMPFAPSVLKEYCEECFVNYHPSPYMNLAFEVRPPYDELIPAVMHVDQTARPQEVDRKVNPLYYATLEAFRQLTDIPLVLNTSFNRHGLPIVCTPRDAVQHLQWGCVDALAIGPFLVRRTGPIVPFPE